LSTKGCLNTITPLVCTGPYPPSTDVRICNPMLATAVAVQHTSTEKINLSSVIREVKMCFLLSTY